ncbi:MAG: adenylyl-sulfate kinase, partial [Pseudomonadota bacterium]
MPVQWVNRPDSEFRGFSGLITSGSIARGSEVVAALSGRASRVTRIVGPAGDMEQAQAGQSVTLCLADEIDISRGDVLAAAGALPQVTDQFAGHIVWMGTEPMLPERRYLARFATATATAQVTDLTHTVDVNTLEKL